MRTSTNRNWKDWRPCGSWLIVKADPRVNKTAGGIVLTEELLSVERPMEGTGRILKVGAGVAEKIGRPLKSGDRICFRGFLKDAFHEFAEDNGCRVFMLKADDVLALVSDDVQMGEFLSKRAAR